MSKKQLDTTEIVSELRQGSVFFQQDANKSVRPVREERPDGPVGPERSVRVETKRREIKRHSFEVYRDQVIKLTERKTEIMKTGELKSMSAMVREAIDNYLEKN